VKLTMDIFNFIGQRFERQACGCRAMCRLTIFIPAITAFHWLNEMRFCKQWTGKLGDKQKSPRLLWDVDSSFEANWAS